MKTPYLAAVAALLMASSTQAAVIMTNVSIPVSATFEGTSLDFTTNTVTHGEISGLDFNPYQDSNRLAFYWLLNIHSAGVATAVSGGKYLNLTPGSVISSASTFSQAAGWSAASAFHSSGDHILGMRFLNKDTGLVNYGYVTFTTTGSTALPATITGWAYETSGGAITVAAINAPAVPEPATWAMMIGGLGLVGASMRRRKPVVSFA